MDNGTEIPNVSLVIGDQQVQVMLWEQRLSNLS